MLLSLNQLDRRILLNYIVYSYILERILDVLKQSLLSLENYNNKYLSIEMFEEIDIYFMYCMNYAKDILICEIYI